MKHLFCETQLFSLKQTIRIVDDTTGTIITEKTACNLKDLGKTIAYMCADEGITDVHLKGSEQFTKTIKNNILTYAETTYGINNINVEVE